MNTFSPPHLRGSDSEKLRQLYSYLYRLSEKLNSLSLSQGTVQNVQTTSASLPANESNFSSVKSLIIQSADVINAYCDAIEKRLAGKYVAQSDFGVYREETAASLAASAKELSVLFENSESIESLLHEVSESITKIHARLRAGLLYHDAAGQAVYGLEIGQRNAVNGVETFEKFARFTSDRLSFYDKNEIEVAYISDYKLYITCAEVKSSLRIGGYLLQNENGLSLRWNGE